VFGKLLLIATIILYLFGCAAQPPISKPPQIPQEPVAKRDPFQAFPEKSRLKALEFEESEEFSQALFHWKVVHSFEPHDVAVSERIKALETRIRMEAENHFLKGLEHFHKNFTREARKEFLLCLAYNPEHVQALDYLKHKLYEPDHLLYETKEGDTFRIISEEMYKDPEKAFLIAYFNDMRTNDLLEPGIWLKLPMVDPAWMAKPPSSEKAMILSRPQTVEGQLREQAEAHYLKGVNYFLAEDLESAIREWEETLRLNPEHPTVRKDLEKARRLLENLKRLP
jgi:tetratricopeptide (TPR) repeat protein